MADWGLVVGNADQGQLKVVIQLSLPAAEKSGRKRAMNDRFVNGLREIIGIGIKDKQVLLDFIHSVPDWDENSPVCTNWTDLESEFKSIVSPLPHDFDKLRNSAFLYLQSNKFSGLLLTDFSYWEKVLVLNLSNNRFNGSIPSSTWNLTHLTTLDLSYSSLSGEISNFNVTSLNFLNLSCNKLRGNVSQSLKRFPTSSFFIDNLSSEIDLSLPLPDPLIGQSENKSNGLDETALLGIIIGVCGLGFLATAVSMIVCCANKRGDNGDVVKAKKKENSLKKKNKTLGSQYENDKITFFEGSTFAFDLRGFVEGFS
ncbi:hypothetical protein Nepgr_010763 [Nepenthes gracilis]|uniref:Uncharacterized protein n=1 Tax=Nepenthes gracilis TaxID=150966 RepID=A0AAD3XLC0_NEPGR|nr:hypothetical protein Nepgr_010763 [Nepenthes gracilis]